MSSWLLVCTYLVVITPCLIENSIESHGQQQTADCLPIVQTLVLRICQNLWLVYAYSSWYDLFVLEFGNFIAAVSAPESHQFQEAFHLHDTHH